MSDFSLQFLMLTHTSFVIGNHNTRMIHVSANLYVTISSPCSLSTLLGISIILYVIFSRVSIFLCMACVIKTVIMTDYSQGNLIYKLCLEKQGFYWLTFLFR